jgi:saccharopine dehydrogenase-like NADP-dependent oxidoreductase
MKKVLVLGAGLVSRPLVKYLLDLPDYEITVATRTVSKADALIEGAPNGRSVALDVEKEENKLDELVKKSDLVVSLVPWSHHIRVANKCIKHKKHMVTTSYVRPDLKAMDAPAKKAGIMFINEIGLDPGIDHMSAMRIINHVKEKGGTVEHFRSLCGALPAPDAKDNPFGYKFSWSPRGVILAARDGAKFYENGELVEIPAKDLFKRTRKLEIEGIGKLEVYANRDSTPYEEKYNLKGAKTIFRGTIRYPGWCETWWLLANIGYTGDAVGDLKKHTFKSFTESLAGGPLKGDKKVIERIKWLGLLDEKPVGLDKGCAIDVLEKVLLEKLVYKPGERDMSLLQHEFEVKYPKKRTRITSTLIHFGTPFGDTSISQTVSLPAAICVRLIFEGKIALTGVHVPVIPELYNTVLDELEPMGIKFVEKETEIK